MTPTAALAIDPQTWARAVVGTVPVAPAIDFTTLREKRERNQSLRRDLESRECIDLFGKYDAVAMNFLPKMLTGIAVEEAQKIAEYCGENRLAEFKRHSRAMRMCMNGYDRDLREKYGTAMRSYTTYLERFRRYVATDLFRAWCTFTNETSRQLPHHPHREIPARVAFARMLLTFVEEHDRQMDRMVATRLEAKVHRRENGYLVGLSCLLIDIAESFGAKLEITRDMELCVKVLANRCRETVRQIIAEEDEAEN